MAQKNDKLFDMEQIDTDKSGDTGSAAIQDTPHLIEKQKGVDAEKIKAERLEALRYAETYRQRLRLEREAKHSPIREADEVKQKEARLERERALEEERERERELAREHSDRVRELLLRLEGDRGTGENITPEGDGTSQDGTQEAESVESKDEKNGEFTPLTRATRPTGEVCDTNEAVDNVISVDMDLKSEVLHIGGINLGQIKVGETVVTDSYVEPRNEARRESVVGVGDFPLPDFITKGAPGTLGAYGEAEAERELITRHSGNQGKFYTDRDDTSELYVSEGLDISSGYPEPQLARGKRVISNHEEYDRVTDVMLQRTAPEGRAYPDLDVSDQYINSDFDVHSTYPEAGREYIARGKTVKPIEYDRVTDIAMQDTSKRIAAYPDPEAPVHNDVPVHIDDTLEDPLPDVPKPIQKLTRQQKREQARAMRELEREDMLRFERESRSVAHFPEVTDECAESGEDIPGSIYPDPDYTTDEPVLYASGNVVSKERQREALLQYQDFYGDEGKPTADGERADSAPVFNKRELKRLVKKSRALDTLCVEQMYESRLRELRLELQGKELRFGKRKEKDERTARDIQKDISRLERAERRAIKEAASDNERYYAPVLTDYTTVKLKAGADRAVLIQKRFELLDELARRDEINSRLISLYTGKEDGRRAHFEGRVMAEMKAKRRAYRRQRRLDREIVKYHISHSFSKRLYALMDEYVTLSGDIARLEYSLKKEKLLRTVKRDMKKERRKLRRKLVRVTDHIDYYEKRAILEAEDRREVKRKMIIGWSVLIGILALGVLAWAFWEPITAYISGIWGGV